MTRAPLTAAVIALGLVLPASASATPTCAWNINTHVLSVGWTATGGNAELSVTPSGGIELDGAGCGQTASVFTVDTIVVKDPLVTGGSLTLKTDNGFAPGFTAESASPEIEFQIDLGTDAGNDLNIDLPKADNALYVGNDGINLNPIGDDAGGPAGVDSDIKFSNVDKVVVAGDTKTDLIDGRGGKGTGGPTSVPLREYGLGGDNILHGGNGNDLFMGANGYDTIDGGPGEDTIQFGTNQRLDLSLTGPQQTAGQGLDTVTGIEDVIGSGNNDVIIGDDGPNVLDGGSNVDEIRGGGGDDTIIGGPNGSDQIVPGTGTDTIFAQNGETDTIDCVDAFDVLHTDDIDIVKPCSVPPVTTPTPTPTATSTPTGPTTPAETDPTPPSGETPATPGAGDQTPPQDGGPTTPGGDDPQHPGGGESPKAGPTALPGFTITASRQSRRAVRKRGLRVRLLSKQDGSVALHAGKAKDVYWALAAGRPLTVRLRVSRRVARRGRAVVSAVVTGPDGTPVTVSRTVRFR